VSSTEGVDWSVADAALARTGATEQALAELRKLCTKHPRSRACALRLIRALVAAKRTDEALAAALKLRADGLATPALMQQIGDLLAAAGRDIEAQSAYSEVVEFAPGDPAARRLLGDIYLRHGWYEPAYRQYRTLGEMIPEDALAQLRLASAAAGAGRVDEALRVERKVASSEGEPGPRDPRRWARHWSAARIAKLMLSSAGKKSETMRQSMERSLRQLQVLASPGVLFVLTWEDLQGRLALELTSAGQPVPRTEQIDAGQSGMVSINASVLQATDIMARVARQGEAQGRPIAFRLAVVVWDGRRMRVAVQRGRLGDQPVTLPVKLP
jgi:tetratricopeptide (TPR) repeat protein